MKLSRYLPAIAAAALSVLPVSAQTFLCRYESGAILFKTTDLVRMTRNKHQVTVQSNLKDGDSWTYLVTFEDSSVGYRAMRSSLKQSKEAGLNVVLGGELFVINDSGKIKLFVTGTNAAAMSSESASYLCTKQT